MLIALLHHIRKTNKGGGDEEDTITAIVYAGFSDMNPALIVAKMNGYNSAELTAYAKEGVIKQHTAEKALQKVFYYKNVLNNDI